MISTIEVMKIAYKNLGKEMPKVSEPFSVIKRHLNYFKDFPNSQPRYMYDLDSVHMYNFDEAVKGNQIYAERADVMMSFWIPFTYYLNLNNDGKIIGKQSHLNMVLERIDKGDEEIVKACTLFEKLSIIYATRGNILLLPNMKNLSGNNYFNPNRACYFEDKIDECLWHMFSGGKLHEYFRSDEHVVEWVLSEHLEYMFKDGDIRRENIICLCPNKSVATYRFIDFKHKDKDFENFMENLYGLIEYRNGQKFIPHLPQEWK